MTGYRKHQVLRQRPPVSFPDDRPVVPFTRDELPYDGVAVQCGRLGAATLTASWIGPRTQQWTLERRRVQVAVGCDRRRPLARTMGRVINFPLVAKKWLTMSPLAADLLMELFTTFTV
jgi:hypothetical protein